MPALRSGYQVGDTVMRVSAGRDQDVRTAVAPSGEAFIILVYPVGAAHVYPAGGGALPWLLGRVWHLLRHRGQWQVEVHRKLSRSDLMILASPPWAIVGSGSRNEAHALAKRFGSQIESGEVEPMP